MRVSLATEPASPMRSNQDFAVATNSLAVLLDGAVLPAATAATGAPCAHDARWFTRALGARLIGELSAEPPVWIAEGVARAIDDVATQHAKTCDIDDETHPSATIAILRELPDVYEYYVLGDSSVVFEMADGTQVVRSDKRLSQLMPDERDRARRNVRGGYWIASANPDAAARGRQGHIGRGNLRRAALLSDGAAAVVERYELMDWGSALDAMDKDGPRAIIRAARDAESSDPRAERWPRSKAGDDATVVLCLPDGR
jgi:hypothetical protein